MSNIRKFREAQSRLSQKEQVTSSVKRGVESSWEQMSQALTALRSDAEAEDQALVTATIDSMERLLSELSTSLELDLSL